MSGVMTIILGLQTYLRLTRLTVRSKFVLHLDMVIESGNI